MLPANSWGQISRGGEPQEIIQLKSAFVPVVEMPVLNNRMLFRKSISVQTDVNVLKPFRFAHAFEVNFNPENSGKWYKTVYGLNSWKLKIHSKEAKSINLIFDQFELPPGSRLFIYNEKENHVLGAFTPENNKSTGKFAISPVLGDEITIHYEVSEVYKDIVPFTLKRVNHDFIGILEKGDRRPLGEIAGDCNIDINCEMAEKWSDIKDAVCRMIVDGVEVCSGALVNNTNEDQKPYIISAGHCYDQWEYAETTVYTFNYESPFCAPLDGDPSNGISGALMKAQFDSLDFALVELSVIPPPDFRPYYIGWDNSTNIPDSSISIHHPQGDVKKIAFDEDPPEIASFNTKYIKDAFYQITEWEEGVTEVGSSGGPLFNMDQNLIGTLTGGAAYCGNPVRDYFERFSMSWDYKEDSTKQLKHWLDPIKSDVETLSGKRYYEREEYCGAFTNLNDSDDYKLVSLQESGELEGYWGGTNSAGITEFMEKFSIFGNEQLSGISFGVGKIYKNIQETNSEITIKVYNGNTLPEELIYSQVVLIKDLVDDAMNFIGFDEIVEPEDTFFVGFELSNVNPKDSIVMYQSLRPETKDNYFYFKQNEVWQNFRDANLGSNSMVNVVELLACNLEDTITDVTKEERLNMYIFPNPAIDNVILKSDTKLTLEKITVINVIGQEVNARISLISDNKVNFNLAGNVPGIYFIRFETSKGIISKKFSYIPW